MANTTLGLKNVNLLNKADFDAISNPAEDELWAVESNLLSPPDYTTAVSVTGTSFTATYKGWLIGFLNAGGSTESTAYINGNIISKEAGDYASIQIPMDVNDTYTATVSSSNLKFFACKE